MGAKQKITNQTKTKPILKESNNNNKKRNRKRETNYVYVCSSILFPVHRGVRQGDPLSPKLFTAVMEEVFKKADISEGVNVDGENLTNLRFADDVVLFNKTTKQMEKHLNNQNSESMKVGLKYTKERQST